MTSNMGDLSLDCDAPVLGGSKANLAFSSTHSLLRLFPITDRILVTLQ